jgi:cytochrome c biogenesis protein CcmG/thiol:disulfide interchange protein DsbE
VPETYLIDGSGHIRLRHVGPLDRDSIERELLPRLKEIGG